MSYVKHILFPGEHILYDGHVHPRILLPGVIWLGISAWIVHLCAHTGSNHTWLLRVSYNMAVSWPWTSGLYRNLAEWQASAPDISVEAKILALLIALWGFSRFMKALVVIQSTELVVTEGRIIAKSGIMAVYTVEMEKNRVAGVDIFQPFLGRILNYGYINIRGFTTHINNLPVMVNPRLVERFITPQPR